MVKPEKLVVEIDTRVATKKIKAVQRLAIQLKKALSELRKEMDKFK